MNTDLRKTVRGIIILFLIFIAAFAINKILDRSADEDIIIKEKEPEKESGAKPETEETTENIKESAAEKEERIGRLKYEGENGDVYEGGGKNGKYDGYGVLTRKTGEVYDGIWSEGTFHSGKITFKINNFGGVKTAEIVYDEKWNGNGKKAAILDSGEIYDGQWQDGEKDGEGIMYSRAKDGAPAKYMEGNWHDGVMQTGTETYIYSDGLKTYTVEVREGLRNGKGILYDEKGNVKETKEWRGDIPIE